MNRELLLDSNSLRRYTTHYGIAFSDHHLVHRNSLSIAHSNQPTLNQNRAEILSKPAELCHSDGETDERNS
jgi:hypothetical protein